MLELAVGLASTEGDRLLQAEALVRGYCGWHIAPSREDSHTVRGVNNAALFLPSLHVTAIESITDAGVELTFDQEYRWSSVGVITRIGYWSDDEIVVTFTHGYADVPADVAAVVQSVAQRAVDNPGSLTRKQIGPFSDTYSTTGSGQVAVLSLLDAEKDILRRYRLPALA